MPSVCSAKRKWCERLKRRIFGTSNSSAKISGPCSAVTSLIRLALTVPGRFPSSRNECGWIVRYRYATHVVSSVTYANLRCSPKPAPKSRAACPRGRESSAGLHSGRPRNIRVSTADKTARSGFLLFLRSELSSSFGVPTRCCTQLCPCAAISPIFTASATPFRRAEALKNHLNWSQSPSHLTNFEFC